MGSAALFCWRFCFRNLKAIDNFTVHDYLTLCQEAGRSPLYLYRGGKSGLHKATVPDSVRRFHVFMELGKVPQKVGRLRLRPGDSERVR